MEDLQSISINYVEDHNAPEIVKKASGIEAEEVIKMAEETGIYIHRDPVLLNHLDNLPEGSTIPKELYAIMAEILSYSYILQGKFPEQWRRPDGTVGIDKKA
ncbi:MAG: EscU/YscU/HrcU family type III secretion system export apparatus switch protein [Succinivibrionaceae bacterium]